MIHASSFLWLTLFCEAHLITYLQKLSLEHSSFHHTSILPRPHTVGYHILKLYKVTNLFFVKNCLKCFILSNIYSSSSSGMTYMAICDAIFSYLLGPTGHHEITKSRKDGSQRRIKHLLRKYRHLKELCRILYKNSRFSAGIQQIA